MKNAIKIIKVMAFLWIIAFSMAACSNSNDPDTYDGLGRVVTYPWPNGMAKYEDITMTADGKDIDLHSVRANNTYAWTLNTEELCDQIPVAMFDMAGTISIEITLPVLASNVIIRPLNSGIIPDVNGNKISFSISQPGHYSVEYNNDPRRPINTVLIFANPIENFTGTMVIEPGIYTQDYLINSGETLYLKAGAVIRGSVKMNSNSKIVGRGIIDGSHLPNRILYLNHQATVPIEVNFANNIEVNGITIFDPNSWNVQFQDTSNVTVNNLKVVSARNNSDGISIQGSNNVTIQNSFLRTWDDGIAIKSYGPQDPYRISVKNCIFWTDLAQSLEIGYETNRGSKPNPKIYDVTFEDIVIIHSMHNAPISIHNGDNADIFNITYKNITIENYQSEGNGWNYLIDITNTTSEEIGGNPVWTTVTSRGNIHDIHIENVRILSGIAPQARFVSSGSGGSVYNVTVKDIFHGSDRLTFSDYVRGPNISISFD